MFSPYDYADELTTAIAEGTLEDALHEIADSAVPVYNSSIIEEWRDNSEYWDYAAEETGDYTGTILGKMQADLYFAYLHALTEYAEELAENDD